MVERFDDEKRRASRMLAESGDDREGHHPESWFTGKVATATASDSSRGPREYRDDPELRNFRADFQQRAPGGENLREVQQRTMRALTEILPFVSEDLLIVAHCQSIRCLIAGLTGCDEATALQLHVPNAEPLLLELTPAGCWKQTDAAFC